MYTTIYYDRDGIQTVDIEYFFKVLYLNDVILIKVGGIRLIIFYLLSIYVMLHFMSWNEHLTIKRTVKIKVNS